MEINVAIREYLEQNGITQTYLARAIGMHIKKLNDILNCKRKLTASEFIKICRVLKINPNIFLN